MYSRCFRRVTKNLGDVGKKKIPENVKDMREEPYKKFTDRTDL